MKRTLQRGVMKDRTGVNLYTDSPTNQDDRLSNTTVPVTPDAPAPTTAVLRRYPAVLIVAIVGLVMIGTGLFLAARSDPSRFSSNVSNDRTIDLLAGAGLLSTLVGIGVFLKAVSYTTTALSADMKTKTNVGAGVGFVLQLAGFCLPMADINSDSRLR